jgi:hypothetical protein
MRYVIAAVLALCSGCVNQMVERPYTRYGVIDDVQSRMVPTLIRQEP